MGGYQYVYLQYIHHIVYIDSRCSQAYRSELEYQYYLDVFEIEFEGIDEYVWTKTEADWEGKDLINLGVLNLGVMGVLTIAES